MDEQQHSGPTASRDRGRRCFLAWNWEAPVGGAGAVASRREE
jgi:hypothetical protein